MLLLVVGPNKVSEYYRPHLKQQIRYVIKLRNNSWQHLDFRTRSEDMPVRTFTPTSEEFLETALQHQLLHFHSNNQKVLPALSFSPPRTLTAWERTVTKSEALILHCSINTGQKTNLHARFGHIRFKGRNFSNTAMLTFRKNQSLSTICETASN